MGCQKYRGDCDFCNDALRVVREWFLRLVSLGLGSWERAQARRAWQEAADQAEAGRHLAGHGCLIFKGFSKAEGN